MRVKGVGWEYSELLRAVGVKTVNELKFRNPEHLVEKMREANKAQPGAAVAEEADGGALDRERQEAADHHPLLIGPPCRLPWRCPSAAYLLRATAQSDGLESTLRSAEDHCIDEPGNGHKPRSANVLSPRASPGPGLLRGLLAKQPAAGHGRPQCDAGLFSDGGRFLYPSAAIAQAQRLTAEGADILDIGADSSRPYGNAVAVPLDEERARLAPSFRP